MSEMQFNTGLDGDFDRSLSLDNLFKKSVKQNNVSYLGTR